MDYEHESISGADEWYGSQIGALAGALFGPGKVFIRLSPPERSSPMNELESAVGLGHHVRDGSDGNLRELKFTCFRTKDSGYTGITDSAVAPGDSICGLLGSNVPHILRKQDDAWIRVGQW